MKKVLTLPNLLVLLTVLAVFALFVPRAFATNGMDLEGYGPVAQAMGGTSLAFDNGSAALMNNPATLGFLADGASYLNLCLGFLGPDVGVAFPAMDLSADSDATGFFMPALGYIRRGGDYTYGFGVFGQGGMGTEYAADTFMAGPTGGLAMSQVSVGRAMAPLAYQVNEKLILGATAEFIWGGMDIQMPLLVGDGSAPSPGSLMDFMGSKVLGEATVSAGLGTAIDNMMTGGMLGADDYARIEFADDSNFSGAASGTGFAGKLGFVYAATPELSVGGTYHLKTAMGDWESDEATMAFYEGDGSGEISAMAGKITVEDFQWPATLGFGLAYRATPELFLAADYRLIQWSGTMEDFRMTFEVTDEASGLAGETMDMTMYQNWDDQSVIQLGAAYRATEALTLRAGANLASNPVPDAYTNPLFPAIEENHFSGGLGYVFAGNQGLDVSLVVAPEVEQANSNTTVVSTHSQFNWQAMYSYFF